MDPLEKKRLANERRLKAIQEQKQRNQKNKAVKAVKIDTKIPTETASQNNFKLFDSDVEEEDDCEDMFKVRPQFEGRKGLKLLEMSSEFSSRFKLDERFRDDEDDNTKCIANSEDEQDKEKDKNFKILESILGYEVSKKPSDNPTAPKKRCIERFDPEDEETSKYIKLNDTPKEPKKKSKKEKKEEVEQKIEPIPISKERYIEVSSNLKDLFNSSSSFTLSSKFESNDNPEDKLFDDFKSPFTNTESKTEVREVSKDIGWSKPKASSNTKDAFQNKNIFTFFIREDDARIKGEDPFMREKSMEEIRETWMKKKDSVMELYRMKKKSYARGLVNKKPTTQGKKTFIKK